MMTPQEAQALRDFLSQLTQVNGISKEPEAARQIAAAFAQQPDAAYLLVQRALLQDQALAAARAEIARLQAQVEAGRDGGRSGGGFLDPANAWGNSAQAAAAVGRMPAQSQRYDNVAPPRYAEQPSAQYAQPPARPGLFGGGGSGFLGSMAATAAGVAGGAFLFQGIESLMGHHGGGMGSGLLGQNGGALPVENTTVNNFYGADSDADRATGDDTGAGADDLADNSDFSSSDDLGSSDDMSSI